MATRMVCDRCKAEIATNWAKGVERKTSVRLPDSAAELVSVLVIVRPIDNEADGPDLCQTCVEAVVTAALGSARWVDLPTSPVSPAAVVPS